MKRKSIEDKLFTVKSRPGSVSHLSPDFEKCKICATADCTYVCPAGVYKIENGKMTVKYENCLECGACKIVCPQGCLKWRYPGDNTGITFRQG